MKNQRTWHLKILYALLLILVSISIFPLWFFGSSMVAENRDRLETQERILQITISKSLAQQISLYVENTHQQVKEFFDGIIPVAAKLPADRFESDVRLESTLESLVTDHPAVIYGTVLNSEARGRGAQAGQVTGINVSSDAFLKKTLDSAFLAAHQGQDYESDPLTVVGPQGNQPVVVMAHPMMINGRFQGMVAAVVTLAPIAQQLNEAGSAGLDAYVVDNRGRIVASNNPDKNVAGINMSDIAIVQHFLLLKGHARLAETSEFNILKDNRLVPMLGTYYPTLGGRWGVIVQRKKSDAFISVERMQSYAVRLALGVIVLSLMVGFVTAKSITDPLDKLTETARAIASRDFTKRADVRSHTEVGELAEGFNRMAETIQTYVSNLKTASEENRQLFFDSIEMIAAAVDAKDPYTKGHSGRVAQYSLVLVRELGLPEEEVEKIRISATLHDVGKIGIEDRILKKPGVLTNDEFEIMKRHTIMGFEIVRQVKQLEEMLPGIRWHHEALNGQGYPDGITGDELPLMARIIAVADTFDAITTDRPYQAGRDFPTALEILRKHAGAKYDPVVVDAMGAAYSKGALRTQEARRSALISVPQSNS
jgi:HD-GYP domain-containing protein (c-di-GMP phosphodiesterase class II)